AHANHRCAAAAGIRGCVARGRDRSGPTDYGQDSRADSCNGIAIHRALIIEDSPAATAQLTRYLQELDVETIAHPQANGSVALALKTRPDVIFLDILLPVSSGWDV